MAPEKRPEVPQETRQEVRPEELRATAVQTVQDVFVAPTVVAAFAANASTVVNAIRRANVHALPSVLESNADPMDAAKHAVVAPLELHVTVLGSVSHPINPDAYQNVQEKCAATTAAEAFVANVL